jgi:hypothetical protein
MWLDRLIVVDDEISSSFSLDDKGNNTVIGGRQVERGSFIFQRSALNYVFLQSESEPTLSTITIVTAISSVRYSFHIHWHYIDPLQRPITSLPENNGSKYVLAGSQHSINKS